MNAIGRVIAVTLIFVLTACNSISRREPYLLLQKSTDDEKATITWTLFNESPRPIWLPVAWGTGDRRLPFAFVTPKDTLTLVSANFVVGGPGRGQLIEGTFDREDIEVACIEPGHSMSGSVSLVGLMNDSPNDIPPNPFEIDRRAVFTIEPTTHPDPDQMLVHEIKSINMVVEYWWVDPKQLRTTPEVNDLLVARALIEGGRNLPLPTALVLSNKLALRFPLKRPHQMFPLEVHSTVREPEKRSPVHD